MYIRQILLLIFVSVSITVFSQKKIELKDVVSSPVFSAKTVTGLHSLNDGLNYSTLEDNKIIRYSYKTGEKVDILFDLSKIENPGFTSFSDYSFSSDENKILFTTKREPIYRHSFTAEYFIWNKTTQEMTPLSSNGAQQLATFSPDGERVAFVRNNNLFIKSLKFATENQVTRDGKKNEVINGAPDWVYEEEFSFNKAFEWSPDSKFLAFIKFNETQVPLFNIPMYQGEKPELKDNQLYPGVYSYKYPKAGENNSVVSVLIYDLKSKSSVTAEVGNDLDQYIPRIKWTADASDLAIMKVNRLQNKLDIVLANPYTGDTRAFFTEKNKRYICEDFYDDFIFLPDNKYIVLNSERDGYSHLYLYDRQGIEIKKLSVGDYDVTDFYGFDPEKKVFYYQAAKESPLRREVYFVSLDGKKSGKLTAGIGTNNAEFSSGYKYFINYFSNSQTPNVVTIQDQAGKVIRTLEDNKALKSLLGEYAMPKKEFFNFKTSEGVALNGWMLKPANFDPSKKYPVVMTQYSGPNSQEVLDRWEIGWSDYLAQEGFVVACVDPRGTGARGEEFRKMTYEQLGKYESDDQVEAARYLGTLSYVDKDNIAIWGWSYGGFMSALCMEKGANVFKAGISVAPVTNWRFYDSVYTERYMRTPKENADGYDDNSPLSHADQIKGKYLLIHGSADDNVHLQNTMEFSEKMVQAGVQFDMATYTNRNHSIRGGNTRLHLYTKMTDWLVKNLK
ncbi:MAG TPA: S9 family peptidase [Prolixibacteraceae bacterium]|jgi:dipeptidyl-peptidase-4|nr:S9 family peptidase [Prolixibacteraceae bacterium]